MVLPTQAIKLSFFILLKFLGLESLVKIIHLWELCEEVITHGLRLSEIKGNTQWENLEIDFYGKIR